MDGGVGLELPLALEVESVHSCHQKSVLDSAYRWLFRWSVAADRAR